VADVSRIYDGLHLSKEFVRNAALHPENLEQEFKDEGERHFKICETCRGKKDQFLPLEE